MPSDNSAYRLYKILENAKNIKSETTNMNAWGQLLQANNDKASLLSRMGKMLELPKEISDSLANVGSADPETTAHISSQLFTAFTNQRFDLRWDTFRNKIDNHLLSYLKLASSLLESQSQTSIIDEEKLENLREKILSLIDEFKQSTNVDKRLKAYIVNQLHKIIILIDDYFITGAQPILHQVEATVGHAFIDPEYKEFLKEEDLGRKLLEYLHVVASVTTVAVGLPEISSSIKLILENIIN
ncbi:hypothetical protein [Psychrobacter sp. AOP7-B1-24]|uniref:hypothetical protein n=1 Tax=Psychrobacter sp. AOP7-B1-24 TaxID=3457645 RepID=UPI00402BD5D5